jgi:hypothetical protein
MDKTNKININKIIREELDRIFGRIGEEQDEQEQPKKNQDTTPSDNPSVNTVVFNNIKYRFKTGVNRNPTKLGIKLQFTPIEGMNPQDPEERQKQDALLQKFLNQKFQSYGRPSFVLDFDTDVPNPNTTGFLIRLGLIESLVDSFFKQDSDASSSTPDNRTD